MAEYAEKDLQEIEKERERLALQRMKFYVAKSKEKIFERALKDIFVDKAIQISDVKKTLEVESGSYAYDRTPSMRMTGQGDFLVELILMSQKTNAQQRYDLLKVIYKSNCFDLIEHKEWWQVLKRILDESESWVRDIKNWKRPARSCERQISSLLKHLFCLYPVPDFMESAWTGRAFFEEHIRWYITIGAGRTLKGETKFPEWMSKKMIHSFLSAPATLTVPQALRYAQVVGLGGDLRTATILDTTTLPLNGEDDTLAIVKFFIGAHMLDPEHYGPMIDFLLHQKATTVAPKRFTMKDRTVQAVLRASEEWHYYRERVRINQAREMARANRNQPAAERNFYGRASSSFKHYSWEAVQGVSNFTLSSKESKTEKTVHTIDQITGSKSLSDEGSELCHCVFSYHASCARGMVSIWSYKVNGKRTCTIELRNQTFTIAQVRGYRNRKPDEKEARIISQWAQAQRLKIAQYVL